MDSIDMLIHTGDYMRIDCKWNNTTNQPVGFGETTANEMCAMVLFYYPYTGLDGCVN